MKMSMVLPVYNEAETLREFFGELVSAVEPLGLKSRRFSSMMAVPMLRWPR